MDIDTPIERTLRTTARERAGLKRLGIATVRDLLYTLPARYVDPAEERPVSSLVPGDYEIGRASCRERV